MSAILIFCIFASNINIRKIMINCSLVIPPLVGWTLVCSGSHGVGFGNNNLNSKVWAELSIHLEVPCRRWQINGVVLGPVSRFIQYCLAILMLSLFLFFLCRGKCKLGQMSSERERAFIPALQYHYQSAVLDPLGGWQSMLVIFFLVALSF